MILLSPTKKKEQKNSLLSEVVTCKCPLELECHLWIKTNLAVKLVRINTYFMYAVSIEVRKFSTSVYKYVKMMTTQLT